MTSTEESADPTFHDVAEDAPQEPGDLVGELMLGFFVVACAAIIGVIYRAIR